MKALVKEGTIGTRYNNYQWNLKVMDVFRDAWFTGAFNWTLYRQLGGSTEYLQLLANIRALVLDKEELYALLNLHGFLMGLYEPRITSPLHVPSVPPFSKTIPTKFFVDDLETYKYDESVGFIPPYRMIVQSVGKAPMSVGERTLLIWTPGDELYDVTGGDRRIQVTAGSLTVLPYVASYDLVLPLGVIAAELDCGEDTTTIRRIGGGFISWEPKRIYGRRRGIPLIIEWRAVKTPPTFSWLQRTPPSEGVTHALNDVLLEDLDSYLKMDQACRRVERAVWDNSVVMCRHLFHTQSTKEQEAFFHAAGEEKIDKEVLLDSCPLVRMAELDYQVVVKEGAR